MSPLRVFQFAILVSALLLFWVQPMFAKMLLPLLGGTPAVWNTCVCFFQATLLAGYLYVHATTRWLGPKQQALLHLALLIVAIATFPVGIGDAEPSENYPAIWLIGQLTISIGLPFFVLSATSPILQTWWSRTHHESADDPYFLYSASNFGSLAGLLCYPVLIEPNFRLDEQCQGWMLTFGVFSVLIALAAYASSRMSRGTDPRMLASAADSTTAGRPPTDEIASTTSSRPISPGPSHRDRIRWIALAFVPSSWMLAVTTYITTDVAPTPLMWVVPLTLYLLSFILVFARKQWIPAGWFLRVFQYSAVLLIVLVLFAGDWLVLLFHITAFFVAAMACHGELATARPDTRHLTEFYVWMSVGGVLGGVFNSLVAPVAFPVVAEYAITIGLGCWLLAKPIAIAWNDRRQAEHLGAIACAIIVAVTIISTSRMRPRTDLIVIAVMVAVPLLTVLVLKNWSRLFAGITTVVLISASIEPPIPGRVLLVERSYFGVHWVIQDTKLHQKLLVHGQTIHGIQDTSPGAECVPLTYYTTSGPLGDVFRSVTLPADAQIALVGLGAGAAVCYGAPTHHFTIYEIDPTVCRIAQDPKLFSHLSRCASGRFSVVLGDGRQTLRRAADGRYSLILLDAFSSDAIPIHLLTREALALYRSKLSPDGLLVFHISNQHCDLEPLLGELAAEAGLTCLVRHDAHENLNRGEFSASYAIIASDARQLSELQRSNRWQAARRLTTAKPWTDDQSNIFDVLLW